MHAIARWRRWSAAALHRRPLPWMLAVFLVIALGVLVSNAANTGPTLQLDGELHHLWVGPVSGRCIIQLAAVDAGIRAGDTSRRWEMTVDVERGRFGTVLPGTVLGDQPQWVELAVWCPALDAEPTRLAPRLLLDPTAAEPAQAGTPPWLCVVPHGTAHGELALRGATLTIYTTVRRLP